MKDTLCIRRIIHKSSFLQNTDVMMPLVRKRRRLQKQLKSKIRLIYAVE
jgi:hypothetical protein